MNKIAILMTCYNRVNTTLKCLESISKQKIPDGYQFDVFLVDDASPDGTGEKVRTAYPSVNVIQGTGDLFWCGGMRLAWDTAVEKGPYDYYLWLNDDVELRPDAFETLIADSESMGLNCIVVGACDESSGAPSYGIKSNGCVMIPNGVPQLAGQDLSMNGNVVLVPESVRMRIGGLSKSFKHAAGDHEYGFRAVKAGVAVALSNKYCGTCKMNPGYDKDKFFQLPLMKRFTALYSPKGPNLPDYVMYKKSRGASLSVYFSYCKWILLCLWPGLRRFFRGTARKGSMQR